MIIRLHHATALQAYPKESLVALGPSDRGELDLLHTLIQAFAGRHVVPLVRAPVGSALAQDNVFGLRNTVGSLGLGWVQTEQKQL